MSESEHVWLEDMLVRASDLDQEGKLTLLYCVGLFRGLTLAMLPGEMRRDGIDVPDEAAYKIVTRTVTNLVAKYEERAPGGAALLRDIIADWVQDAEAV